jgi:hypothetical protein
VALGEERVRTGFSPSSTNLVDQIKQKSAELINLCDEAGSKDLPGEHARLWGLAMTRYEEAAMWAVKAATA